MDGGQSQKARSGVSGVFNLVPSGLISRKRKFIAARFPQGQPSFGKGEFVLSLDAQNAPVAKLRDSAPSPATPLPALLLSCKQPATAAGGGGGGGAKVMQGLPRTDAGGNYFVVMKSGRNFSVYPLAASYTFKPLVRPAQQTVEEVEAAAAAAGRGGGEGPALVPKSLRAALREAAAEEEADRRLRDEAVPLLKDKVAELAARYDSAGGSPAGKLVQHGSDDESDEGSDGFGGGGGGAGAGRGGRAGRRGRDGAGARKAGGGKGKKGGKAPGAGGPVIPEDEEAEDIYAGEEDELRPVRPTEDVDWEFAEGAADDDLDMGASDEEGLEDDPGYRKQLGLEGDEEEEEEERKAKREAELAADADAAAAAAQGAGAAQGQQGAAGAGEGQQGGEDGGGGGDADDEEDDEEDDVMLQVDDEHFDADDLDRLAEQTEAGGNPLERRRAAAGATARERSSPAPGAGRVGTPLGATRGGTPAGGRQGTGSPAPTAAAGAAAAAAAGRGATPPGKAAAGSGSGTPPPGSGAAAAAARRLTPPPSAAGAAGLKRKRDPAGADGAGGSVASGLSGLAASSGGAAAEPPARVQPQQQQPGQAAWEWSPEQLDAMGVPTTDGIVQALSAMGPVPTDRLQLLQDRLNLAAIGPEGKTLLKRRLLQVAKVGLIEGRKYMVLK